MPWKWRKILNVGGGLRANISRGGIGWSWGIPGFRVGRGADSSFWISIGIPGTGLYFTKRFYPNKASKKANSGFKTDNIQENHMHSDIKKWRDIR